MLLSFSRITSPSCIRRQQKRCQTRALRHTAYGHVQDRGRRPVHPVQLAPRLLETLEGVHCGSSLTRPADAGGLESRHARAESARRAAAAAAANAAPRLLPMAGMSQSGIRPPAGRHRSGRPFSRTVLSRNPYSCCTQITRPARSLLVYSFEREGLCSVRG